MNLIAPQETSNETKLAIICEEATSHDASIGELFSGPHGDLVFRILSKHGIWRPNTLRAALITGRLETEAKHKQRLKESIEQFAPNLVLLLGPTSLAAAGIKHSLDVYRGSLFICEDPESPFFNQKCLATFSADRIFKSFEDIVYLNFDLVRAAKQATFPQLNTPERLLEVHHGYATILEKLDEIVLNKPTISIDIEGGIPPKYPGITCISISTGPKQSFIIPAKDYTPEQMVAVLRKLSLILGDQEIPKVLQNSLYDSFVLTYLWKCPLRNVVHDTMLSGWELFPEMEKGLGVQASIYTLEPYYKNEGKMPDDTIHYTYCCKDSAVTAEIAEVHTKAFQSNPTAAKHFEFNMQLLPALLYSELKGIRYLQAEAKTCCAEIQERMAAIQKRIDTSLGIALNVNSPKQMVNALYELKGYPPQYIKENGRKTNRKTAGVDALLELYRGSTDEFLHDILMWRQLDSEREQLAINCDDDGRMRASYNIVGTKSGRLSSSKSPTGNGFNLQTIMKTNRRLYVADEGYVMIQCDLNGADGWTVAAHCKALGDPTMWDDYLAGIKPARVIAAMYLAQRQGTLASFNRLSREELKTHLKKIDIPEWLYNAAKAVQHGSNYQMRGKTMSLNILKRAWKDANTIMYVSPSDCDALQNLYLNHRYLGVEKWHAATEAKIYTDRKLTSASGHVRKFFGRPQDKNVIRDALSQEPQHNTTYATNMALWNLWHDEENHFDDHLEIQPLHQIHDALLLQVKVEKLEWAKQKIYAYFNNPIIIAGQELVIPFEGGYGPNWRDTKTPL